MLDVRNFKQLKIIIRKISTSKKYSVYIVHTLKDFLLLMISKFTEQIFYYQTQTHSSMKTSFFFNSMRINP